MMNRMNEINENSKMSFYLWAHLQANWNLIGPLFDSLTVERQCSFLCFTVYLNLFMISIHVRELN